MAKRYLRLEDAADKLEAKGFPTGQDYHTLSTDNKLLLGTVMAQTIWRQSPSSAKMGRSRSYSFWLAVSRYWQAGGGPKRQRATSVNVVQGPTSSGRQRTASITTITLKDRVSRSTKRTARP